MEERMMHGTMLINLIGLLAQVHTKDLLANQRSNTQLKMDWSEASSVDMVQDSVGNAHGSMDMLVNKMMQKMFERTYKAPLMHQTDVDKATLGKPGHIAVPHQSSHLLATHHLPAVQPRLLPNFIARRAGHSAGIKQKSSVHWPAPVSAATLHLEAAHACPPVIPKYGHIQEIHSEEELNHILQETSGLVMLEVGARFCRACRTFACTYQQIAKDHNGQASFLKVAWDENKSTHNLAVKRLEVKKAPSFFVFLDGNLVSVTKAQPRDALEEALRSTLENPPASYHA
eukprot:gnl/MRDRNA2_/MRDRNA2_30834_c0_seq1.p1 gnl/MRDRNA2_/MRDRNA2_30834_c0~~gnl/MRDRNA2_/MRDRNA2_30834_c0_seq1.p1  ORF type:complete len:286 (+),score=42.52 gnl/MRDRNA2_/MRDRNA2_30834_c0_seq1:46-903(+)